MYDLALDIKNNTLDQCMERYFKAEYQKGNNKYECSKCKKLVDAEKRLYIKKLPNNLVIQLVDILFILKYIIKFSKNNLI